MSLKVDSDNLQEGLLGLVIALVEIIKEVLQRQALYRFESRSLSEKEAEKLGLAFMQLDETLQNIKQEHHLEKITGKIRNDLDGLVNEGLTKIIDPLAVEGEKNV